MDTNGLTYSDHWNQVSPENAGKWGAVQGSPTSGFNWNTLDAIHDYTTQKGILFKEHCFLWGSQQPEPQSSITETHVKNWMQQFCDRYPDAVVIDVVNEPPPHTNPQYANAIGGGTNGNWAWIANAFKWADAACPNAILVLNDYNTIEWPNDNQRFIDIVKAIQAAGAPIDAVGAQAHDLDHGSVTFATVERLLTKLHDDTGLPVYITEMDLSYTDDAAQLSAYQRFFPLFWEAPYVQGITIWGWIYGQTWSMAPNSGLVRDGRSRSAMTWLMDQLDRPAP
ncbi:MAG: endo-1,4-beta-xylanase [Polyangiaceae bacterium]|nr:endo-1,4-beta-xylanase [Polyangiaceae bacterium]